MKQYKLLKDLPFAKAGEIFIKSKVEKDGKLEEVYELDNNFGYISADIVDTDEWFKEIKEPKEYWYVSSYGTVKSGEVGEYISLEEGHKRIGDYFTTEQEAKKHLEWLKARTILLEDTKGFKPDWDNLTQSKWYVEYNHFKTRLETASTYNCSAGVIYFRQQDVENSMKNHEKEWKIYLGVE